MSDQQEDILATSRGQSQRDGFIFNDNDKTVYDPRTRLIWLRDANSFAKPMYWQDAINKTKRMNFPEFVGLTGWRLPTKEELESMAMYAISANYENREKYTLSGYFNGIGFDNVMSGWYWSSNPYIGTPNKNPNDFKMAVSMDGSDSDSFEVTEKCYVWPVRDMLE